MAQHTPGPWRIVSREVQEDGSVFPKCIVGGPKNHTICPLEANVVAEIAVKNPGTFWDTTPGKEANARLIAAAPDLLEFAEYVRELAFDFLSEGIRPHDHHMRDLAWKADKLLNRATGEPA